MVLENKLGITDPAELARAEEKRSKTNAARLFESGELSLQEPRKSGAKQTPQGSLKAEN